jgi:integrase
VAYIRKRGGSWVAEVERDGVRRSRSFDTKAEAANWGAQEEAAILAAQRGQFPVKTLRQAIERYVKEVTPGKATKRTEELRFEALMRNYPTLANRMLADLKPSHLADWRDDRLKDVTPGTVQREINSLSHLFTVAREEWRWMGESPLKGMRQPGDNPPRERRIAPMEVFRICRRLGYRRGIPCSLSAQVGLMFLIGLRTAMRAGEIHQLGDATVDLERRVARVKHKMQRLTGKVREIPLTRAAVRLLRPLAGSGAQWFTVSQQSRDALFRKACTQLLIKDLHFHDSRAEALTRLSRKVDVMTLARVSGHSDLRILLNTYFRESAEEIAARL